MVDARGRARRMRQRSAWTVSPRAAGQHLLNATAACAVAAIGSSNKLQYEGDIHANPRTWRSGNLHAGQLAPRINVGASGAMARELNEGVDWRASIPTHFPRLRS